MGRAEYFDPVSQSRKPIKAGSIVSDAGLEYTPDQIKVIDDKIGNLSTDLVSHKADYEYQNPTVVGRQIRVEKQSSTNIVKFKLNTDIAIGAQITISTNGGSTSKPLVDFDGVAITELEKGFVEVIENSVNFTFASKGAKLKLIESTVQQSGVFERSINGIVADNDYIYVICSYLYISKVRISDMEVVAQSPRLTSGATNTFIELDETYIYCANNDGTIGKFLKTDLSIVSQVPGIGLTLTSFNIHGEYIYTSQSQDKKINVRLKSTLALVSSSSAFTSNVNTIFVDDTHIYSGDGNFINKILKSSLSQVSRFNYSTMVRSVIVDSTYLYCAGSGGEILKLLKSNFTNPISSSRYGKTHNSIILCMTLVGDYIYIGGFVPDGQNLVKVNKDSLAFIFESPMRNKEIRAISVNDKYVFYGGGDDNIVLKINREIVNFYKYKGLSLFPMEV